MSAVTDQKPSRFFHWMQSWFSKARPMAAARMPADYQALTLELAAADDSSMSQIIQRSQQRLRYLLHDHSLQLAVVLPAASGGQTLFHAGGSGSGIGSDIGDSAADSYWLQTLTLQLTSADLVPGGRDHQRTIALSHNEDITLCQLDLGADNNPGWLAVLSSLSDYDKESLYSLTQTLRPAFSQGLTIYCQRQQAVAVALKQERSAQAAELHDSLAQVLGYLRIRTARLQTFAADSENFCQQQDAIREISDEIAGQTLMAYRQARELISASRLTLREQSLEQIFSHAIDEFAQHSAIVFQLDNRCTDISLNERQLTQLSHIVRESLANIVRHSHASHARIRALLRHGKLQISIEDNGRGIAGNQARSDSYGLMIMQERAATIGARCVIKARKSGGTVVEISFPVKDK